jgi:hypothetical protein
MGYSTWEIYLNEKHRRHMYIKTSPMQDLGVYCYRCGYLENVQGVMIMVPPTKVLLEIFFCTYAFLKKIKKCFCVLRVRKVIGKQGSYESGVLKDIW